MSFIKNFMMNDSIEELETICELLIELTALQRLEAQWRENVSTTYEHERLALLERVIRKKERQRFKLISALKEDYPEIESMFSKHLNIN